MLEFCMWDRKLTMAHNREMIANRNECTPHGGVTPRRKRSLRTQVSPFARGTVNLRQDCQIPLLNIVTTCV